MKKIMFGVFLYTCITGCDSRPKPDKDQLVVNICRSFEMEDNVKVDSAKVSDIVRQHLEPYLTGMPADSVEALVTFVDLRLQRECVPFKRIMDRLTGINKRGDWKMVNEEPDSETSEDDLRHFFQLRNFKYVEANGDTTSVKVTDTSWVDHFRDGTYSRLSLRKVKENEYVISFMESDNILRKNLSKPGDKYRYKILKRYQNYYLMYVEPVGSDVKSEFKLYY